MNVFEFRKRLIEDYAAYVTSFISIRDQRIQQRVDEDLEGGLLWPEPSIGLNPSFAKRTDRRTGRERDTTPGMLPHLPDQA